MLNSILQAIRELYDAGVDCGIESFQGSGVVAWVVDAGNRRIEKTFGLHEIESVSDWLITEAARQRAKPQGDLRSPRDLLAELANARRRDTKRVTADERRERREHAPPEHHRTA